MKISVFPDNSAIAGRPVFEAFIESLSDVEVVYNDMNADVAVIWSVLWSGRMAKNKPVYDWYRSQNKPVIILEVGGINRNETWKVCINGINNTGDFGIDQDCDDRRVQKLELELKPWQKTGSNILICGQHGDSELWKGMPPVQDWMVDTVRELKKHTDRKIVLRPHPRFKVLPQYSKEFSNVLIANPKKIEGSYDDFNFEDALAESLAVVCYSSGLAVNAVMSGTPVYCGVDSLSYDVSNDIRDLSTIEQPNYPDRTQWLNNISYTEWTVQEIRDGEPWDRIKGKL